jgi:hypothetical protein
MSFVPFMEQAEADGRVKPSREGHIDVYLLVVLTVFSRRVRYDSDGGERIGKDIVLAAEFSHLTTEPIFCFACCRGAQPT